MIDSVQDCCYTYFF